MSKSRFGDYFKTVLKSAESEISFETFGVVALQSYSDDMEKQIISSYVEEIICFNV